MHANFKLRPAWAQFFTFIGIAAGSFLILSAIGLFIVGGVAGIKLSSLVNGMDLSRPGMLVFMRGMIIVQFLGLFLIPVFTFAAMADPKPLHYLRLTTSTTAMFFVVGVLIMFVSLPLVEALGLINQQAQFPDFIENWMKTSENQAADQIKLFLRQRTPMNLFLNLLLIAGFAGIGEELFFRGVLQRIFIQWFRSPWLGIIAAAFVFAAIHMQFYGFLPRFLLGILLGALYWYSGSLWPAILAHFLYDAFFVVAAYFNPQFAEDETATLFSPTTLIIPALLSAAACAFLLRWMIKHTRVHYDEWQATENAPAGNPFNF